MNSIDNMRLCCRTCGEYRQPMLEANSDAVCRKSVRSAISATVSRKSGGMGWVLP